ncbi:hypothetical protein KPH14_013001 [Odynerus spinipes]|uniref:Transposase n=1 Tax=Odynerus spinipes TaxID=1348599 RepID=A0AAD9R7Z3_9HYME|nr:hypothetical protein KPH14_013001 [Odynerus spinipes]
MPQDNLPSSDTEDMDYNNNGVVTCRRKNKRRRISSTSADEGDQNSNLNLENSDSNEVFSSWSKTNFNPVKHAFDDRNSGVKSNLTQESTPLDAFQHFFSEQLLSDITKQTNNYFTFVKENTLPKTHSRINSWKPTSICEMYGFLAIMMLMPRTKKLTLNEYWSTDELIKTYSFRKIMARDRFMLLLQMLHFNDNNVRSDEPLFKIRHILDALKNSFAQSFYPYQEVCIDESLMLFKGRCHFRQFIPSKRSRFGIKTFVLCDCKTNYVLDFIVYTGRHTDIVHDFTTIGQAANVVMTLLRPYLGKGHTVITDNWYTSPHLYNLLHKEKTNAYGTVRKNRKDMPEINTSLRKGKFDYRCTDNLLVLKWRDKKDVWMLSTIHEPKMVETGRRNHITGLPKLKPECVVNYNIKMGSVDHVDMVLSTLHSHRKCLKWYKKLFFHLLDLSLYNSYILHQSVTGKKQKYNEFQLKVIKQILQKYPQNRKSTGGGRRNIENLPYRLTERHFPSKTLNAEGNVSRRKCVVCKKQNQRKDTPYQCKKCNVGLCVDNCFEIYHTQLQY